MCNVGRLCAGNGLSSKQRIVHRVSVIERDGVGTPPTQTHQQGNNTQHTTQRVPPSNTHTHTHTRLLVDSEGDHVMKGAAT